MLYRPLTLEELIEHFGLEDSVERIREFTAIIREMEQKGQIILTRKKRYSLPEHMNLIVGRIQRNPKGFAFLIPDNPLKRDVYLKSEDLNGAMHNDRVVVRLRKHLDPDKSRKER